jgi:putative oxidoreductase
MKLGMTVLRITVGGLFVGHGTQKLFGWFGGEGPDATGGFFEQKLGMAPGKQQALAAGAAEAGGGALLAGGLLTPLGAMLTTSTMATAIRLVHARRGVWNTSGGFEYNAVLMAAAFAIVAGGPGTWSLDAARGRERWGDGWAVAQLAGGLAGSALAVELGQRLAKRAEAKRETEQRLASVPDDAPEQDATRTNGHRQPPAHATA